MRLQGHGSSRNLVVCYIASSLLLASSQDEFADPSSSCDFNMAGSRSSLKTVDGCMQQLLPILGLPTSVKEGDGEQQITDTCFGRMRGLASQVGYVNATRSVCWATPGLNMTGWACEALSSLAWELFTVSLRHVVLCSSTDQVEEVEKVAVELFDATTALLQAEVDLHVDTSLHGLIGLKLQELRRDFSEQLQPHSYTRQVVSRLFALCRRLCEHVNFLVWRDTHFMWLADSLKHGKVVHSSWGGIDRWDELGANDARSEHPLVGGAAVAPRFRFSSEVGQRRDIFVSLLKKLQESFQAEGSDEPLVVVEVGVFRAGLSQHLLEKLPSIRLIGVDPYVGKDGTFPGDFSVTLDPNSALATAQAVYDRFSERASLLPVGSEEAAAGIPDRSVDAVFVDGCHLYECVDTDLRAWLPKLRGRGSLLVGHDFSPQWPGVVRAVFEHRAGGRDVFLGHDWTYWWYLD
eukprot:TRINITY_DN37413_c0_g2_i1.p1 TRINITY_DN37413_c0_g2~~TRINITY_DN37413_c0_g2_i1.p1  ORF type:complete len:462 (+),score=45.62 TRINITY_DN37413_c0_g2_i1:78-1463(+)